MMTSWFSFGKPDLSMALNGVLAGLVGITAGADTVGIASSGLIGLVAGVLVVYSVMFFDRLEIDDPVGAISVHLVCGIWGTLAVGIFSTNPEHSFVTQLIGVAAYGVAAFGAACAIFGLLEATLGIRVSEGEELEGLDLAEHGAHAYDLSGPTSILETVTGRSPVRPHPTTVLADERA